MGSVRHPLLRTFVLLTVLTTTSALAGCQSGPARGDVRGKVTFKGQPVTEGMITFINPNGGEGGEMKLGPDGSYEIPRGLPVGDYIVLVTPLIIKVDTSPGKTPPSP